MEPNLVFGEKDGTEVIPIKGEAKAGGKETVPYYQSVDYAKLTPLLVKAIQELSQEKADREQEITNLENRIEQIEQRLI